MGALFFALAILIALSHAPGLLRVAAARLGGMRIDRIVIGVAPVWRRGRWVIGAIPIGTFLVIAGRDATLQPTSPELFSRASWPLKLTVLLAAPISFYLLSAAVMAVTYVALGVPSEGHRPMVGALREGKPAERAGLKPGDHIVAIDNQPIQETTEVAPAIARGGASVVVEIVRDGEHRVITVEPEGPRTDRRIGIEIWPIEEYQRGDLVGAVWEGVKFPARYTAFVGHSVGELVRGKQQVQISGPVGLIKVGQRQVSQGLRDTLQIIAVYSVYLALCFLWPLPIFDGGRLIGYLVRRKPDSPPGDFGEVARAAGRMPVSVILAVLLMALLVAGALLAHSWETAVLALLVIVGLAMRSPAGWQLGRTLCLSSLIGAPLFVWLSLRPARSWFGLACPQCGGDGRPVLAEKHHFGCLRCGSTWVTRPR